MSNYPRIALVDALTPGAPEHYQKLAKSGVKDVIVCLSLSHFDRYRAGEYHTLLAREIGMRTHACLVTDLSEPFHDARHFFTAYQKLGYSFGTKVMILCQASKNVKNTGQKLTELLGYISYFVSKGDIDVAFNKKDLDRGYFNVNEIPDYFNLTIINPRQINSGIDRAGTWISTKDFDSDIQYLGYDYYGFYTSQGYQMTLEPEYIAQEGDTWVTIATRHGIWLPKLLELNKADYEDIVVPGQKVRLF
ncbi:LysM peptidoglycan-binding domain-containing protein [Lactobacillus taiwanensis]|uniref:LysM peptidoglycan-binding domain-containing protein n=1 Tax=Lactobacillus taiwanensis TaxID=508451 RepID=UPI001AEBF5A6|nr:LysM domain-containing protein [Lactobacillus taiwanensis]QTQ40918.1 LysM peptidoglycan-binding domain-containing protein [Lactobacillus taiwanensis]